MIIEEQYFLERRIFLMLLNIAYIFLLSAEINR